MFTLPPSHRLPFLWGGCGGGGVFSCLPQPVSLVGGLGGVGLVVVYRIVVAILSSGNPLPFLLKGGLCRWLAISTSPLNPLPGLHVWPINPIVFGGPLPTIVGWRTHLGAGFPLRCFQRLSLPNVANQPYPWRDNWHTRGSSVPVLSY